MRRLVITPILATFLLVTAQTFAAETDAPVPPLALSAASLAAAAAPVTPPAAAPDFSATILAHYRRPSALPAMYLTAAALQGYDAYSTMTALRAGGVEANPVMKSLVKSPVAFVAMKASVTTLSILAAEQMWRSHHRGAAIGLMVVSNLTMGLVAAHNAQVLAAQR